MAKARNTKRVVDPIFAVIDGHRRALAAHELIIDRYVSTPFDAPERQTVAAEIKASDNAVAEAFRAVFYNSSPTTAVGKLAFQAWDEETDAADRKPWTADRAMTHDVCARLGLLACERPSIRSTEIKKALKSDKAMFAFCHRHEVNLDWLFMGSLKGLFFMIQDARR
jgi:hypothetical protein